MAGEKDRTTYLRCSFCGKTQDEVKKKLDDLIALAETRRYTMTLMNMQGFLSKRGFSNVFGDGIAKQCSLEGWIRGKTLVVRCDFEERAAIALACGRMTLAHVAAPHADRLIILGYAEDGYHKIIEMVRAAGFEFMTPNELIASLGQ